MNFEIGQKVVCIQGYTSLGLNLVEDEVYIIKGITNCNCAELVYVGINTNAEAICQKCNHIQSKGRWFHYATRFAPIEDMEEAESAVNKLLKEVEKTVEVSILN